MSAWEIIIICVNHYLALVYLHSTYACIFLKYISLPTVWKLLPPTVNPSFHKWTPHSLYLSSPAPTICPSLPIEHQQHTFTLKYFIRLSYKRYRNSAGSLRCHLRARISIAPSHFGFYSSITLTPHKYNYWYFDIPYGMQCLIFRKKIDTNGKPTQLWWPLMQTSISAHKMAAYVETF